MKHSVAYGLLVSVSIRREGDTTYVDVHAPMYMNKEWTMPHCYGAGFTDEAILQDRDFITTLINHYGV